MTQSEQGERFKICIVTISLSSGGAERSTALLSRLLDKEGFEVHLVTLNNNIDYSYSGKLYNLGENKTENESFISRLSRFNKFKKYLLREQFDYIIDNRNRQFALKELFYLNYIYKGCNIIYVVRSFNLSQYFPKNKIVAKAMVKKSVGVVGVSKAIAQEINAIYKTDKAVCIYNPIETFNESSEEVNFKSKYILFLGRLVESVKNFSLLLESYKKSKLISENISLKILGDGPDKSWIKNKISSLGLTDYIEMIPFTTDVNPYLENAFFLTLTSKYEGFPRVLIESLSVGTPVISVNCESGPNEIIKDEFNGLLVENFNSDKLSEAFNRFILDEDLYLTCKQNAKQSIEHLQQDVIAKQWTKYLNNEIR